MNRALLVVLLLVSFAGCTGGPGDAAPPPQDDSDAPAQEGRPGTTTPDPVPPVDDNGTAPGHPIIEAQGCDGTTYNVPADRDDLEARMPPGVTPQGSSPVVLLITGHWICDSARIGKDAFADEVSYGLTYVPTEEHDGTRYVFEAWTDWAALRELWRSVGVDALDATATATEAPVPTVTVEGDGIRYVHEYLVDDVHDYGASHQSVEFLGGPAGEYRFRRTTDFEETPALLGELALNTEQGFLADVYGPGGAARFLRQDQTERFTWLENKK